MAKIETIRHSLAHLLAYAVKEIYGKVLFGIGPIIENGFYYDFDFGERKISESDLAKIEEKMKELILQNIPFKKKVFSKNEAKKLFADQPYKLELIEEIEDEKVSTYECGKFLDLCKGPHVRSTREIDPEGFKLVKIAGAYWKGFEKNPMLTRIYGIAFENKEKLEQFLRLEEEAKKRDHRFLGERLDLFHIDEMVGGGLILWHPKGAQIKKIIEDFVFKEYLKFGYLPVCTPHVGKISLWQKSGHLDFYKEYMFPPMRMTEIEREEKEDYQLKPMNCPFHILIYKTKIRSYRDLPLRFTELGTVYRYERSGTLFGLTRVRGFTQDDAHIFCQPEKLAEELIKILKLTFKILKAFEVKDFKIYLSTKPEKFIGTEKIWKKAEKALKFALNKLNLKFEIDKGGGAFYGPKIDVKIKDAIGREWQCTTIQVDFNLPEKFDIYFINQKGKKQRPIMIHRAILGSVERFIGVLLEYHSGNLPFWVCPEQVWIIPVGSKNKKYASLINKKLENFNLRTRIKDEKETVAKKVREWEIQKIPYLLVVGDKEQRNKTVRVRERQKGDVGEMKIEKFLKKVEKLRKFNG